MVIGKMKPVATIVAQFAAGVEVECISHNGKMFLPVISGEFMPADESGDSETESEEAPAKPAEKSASKPSKKGSDKPKSETKKYTLEDLMDTDSKELVGILKKEFGIDPNDYDGKNTNKKLRDLILKAQEEGGASSDNADDSDEDESEKESDDIVDKIADLLEAFDAGDKSKKKVVASIVDMGDDVDEDEVLKLVNHFEEDGDADIEETAEKIAKVVDGDSDDDDDEKEEEEKKPVKKGPKKGKKDEDLVDPSDLEVGDRVSVWWNDENKEWFDGEVKSIKKGKIVIAYDDDTEEPIDPEVHTKIKRLAE